MFALVRFDDEVLYICKKKDVTVNAGGCTIRYKGSRFAGKVLAVNVNKQKLVILKEKFDRESEENEKEAVSPTEDIEKSNAVCDVEVKKQEPVTLKEELNLERKKNDDEAVLPAAGIEKSNAVNDGAVNEQELITIKSKLNQQSEEHDDEVVLPAGIIEKLNVVNDGADNMKEIVAKDRQLPIVVEQRVGNFCNAVYQNNFTKAWELNVLQNVSSISMNNTHSLSSIKFLPEEINVSLGATAELLMNNSTIVWDNILSNGTENNNSFNYQIANEITTPVPERSTVTDHHLLTLTHPENIAESAFIAEVAENIETKKYTSLENVSHLQPLTIGMVQKDKNEPKVELDQNNGHESSDESEYIPDSNDSDESSYETHAPKDEVSCSKSAGDESGRSLNSTIKLDSSQSVNTVGHSAPDDTRMFITTVESGTKKDYCVYCNTNQAKLSRHMVRKHKREEEVAKFLSYEKGSDERKKVMDLIRKRGHFIFNTSIALNTGERKIVRRPNARFGKSAIDFATCPSCFGDYAKTSLRHHVRRCKKKNKSNRRDILINSKKITGRIHHFASNILRQRVFPTMQEDDIVKAIRYDELVILFGNKLCQKYKDPHFYNMIRQKLRQLGRFLLELRKHTDQVDDFFSVYYPKNYDVTIYTVQTLAGLNDSQTGYKIPSLATSIGTLIKQVGKLCISEMIKRQDKQKQTYAEDFLKLLTEDYTTSIARTALESWARQKRQKKVTLPSAEDINKLQVYLRKEVKQNYEALNHKFSVLAWTDLASSVLVSLQLFNRRRPGETERILIADFENYSKIDETCIATYKNFTLEEKKAAQTYVRFEIRGKLNRTVPVLMHRELLVCIQLLLKFRTKARVDKNNPYVFGISGSVGGDYKYLRGCNLMRHYAVKCGATQPETLRGTVLRKHIATMCINFNLTDEEVSDLANFMGHADKIHKDHYRQTIVTREILQISKLLETVQGKQDDFDDTDSEEDEEDSVLEEADVPISPGDQSQNQSMAEMPINSTLPEKKSKKSRRTRSISPYGTCKRVRWTEEEKNVALKEFRDCIKNKTLPSFKAIQDMMDRNRGVFNRNIASIKTWINNQIKKK